MAHIYSKNRQQLFALVRQRETTALGFLILLVFGLCLLKLKVLGLFPDLMVIVPVPGPPLGSAATAHTAAQQGPLHKEVFPPDDDLAKARPLQATGSGWKGQITACGCPKKPLVWVCGGKRENSRKAQFWWLLCSDRQLPGFGDIRKGNSFRMNLKTPDGLQTSRISNQQRCSSLSHKGGHFGGMLMMNL